MTDFEKFSVVVAVFGALILAIEVYYIYRTFRMDHVRTRKQATLEFLDSITQQYSPIRDSLEKKFGNTDLIAITVDLNDLAHEDIAGIRRWLNRLEHLAVGVHQGIFDIDVVSYTMGSALMKRLDEFKPYIEVRREISQTAYAEFEFMVNNIKRIRQHKKPLKFNAKQVYSSLEK